MAEFSKEELLRKLKAGESLERADLTEIDLEGTSLAGANLARADLRGANLAAADLTGADLTNASLREAFLEGAKLSGATLRNADMESANLTGADLSGADLSRANLEGANAEGAHLNRARLSYALLSDANLGKAELAEANLRSADLSDTYLGGAKLERADLRRAALEGANLEEADLSSADLRQCDLRSSVLEGTILDGAKVYGIHVDPDVLAQTLIEWWDTSRAGDGSEREEGPEIGAFLGGDRPPRLPAAAPPAQAGEPGTRYFGPGDVLKNAELEFSAQSIVEVQGRFENCKIALGEDAQLRVGETGLLQDCAVTGHGVIHVLGRMLNESPKTVTTSKVFFVGATGSAVGTVKQPSELTRFGFEPGCVLRLRITA